MSLRSMVEGLYGAGVEFVVIGGVAANVQGSPRVTNDLDICYHTTLENRERLASLLNMWHAELRGADPGLPFTIDERTLRECPLLTLTTSEGFLDIMDSVQGIGSYAEVLAGSERTEWNGVEIYSLSLPALISAKRATGRKRDREHVLELEAMLELRRRR